MISFIKKISSFIFPLNTLLCCCAIVGMLFTVFALDWIPCPMCLVQQGCIIGILLLSIIGWTQKNHKISSSVILSFTILLVLVGGFIAADQTYIQYFPGAAVTTTTTPTGNVSCGVVTSSLLIDAAQTITGTVKNCAEISDTVYGVSLAIYSFIFFVFLFLINSVSFTVRLFRK